MTETKETQQNQGGDYAPKQYSFRNSAITTLKAVLIGGGALGALWLIDMLVAR